MQKKAPLIAIGVFAALLLVTLATAEREVSVGVKHLQLDGIAADALSSIELSGSQKVTLKKEGATWNVVLAAPAGKQVPADENLIKPLLEGAAAGLKGDYVSSKPEKQTDTELTEAKALTAKVNSSQGKAVELMFGRSANTGGTFVRQVGSDDIFVTSSQLPYLLRRDANAWRKRSFVGVSAPEVKRVSFQNAAGSLNILGADDGSWSLDKATTLPAGFRVDGETLSRVPGEVTSVTAAEFVDAELSDQVLGFAATNASVTIETKDGKTKVLKVGTAGDQKLAQAASVLKGKLKTLDDAGDKDGQLSLAEVTAGSTADATLAPAVAGFAVLARGAWSGGTDDTHITQAELEAAEKQAALTPVRLEGDSQVYLVQPFISEKLVRSLDAFRNLKLMDFDVSKVTKFAITFEGKQTIASKTKDGWQVVEPKTLPPGFEFDPGQVDAQLNQLKNLHAVGLAPADAAAKAMSKPTVTLELTTDAKTPLALKVGAKVNDASDEYAATGNADALTYRLGGPQRQQYARGVELFKKPVMPPNMGGMGNMQGLESLPPDIRRQIEAQLRAQQR